MDIENLKIILLKSNIDDFVKALDDYCINDHDLFGNNILHYYLKHARTLSLDFKNIIDVLISRGLDINDKQSLGQFKRTCLQMSVVLNLREIFDFLIEKGADVNTKDANGNSILNNAVFNYAKDSDNYGYFIKKLLERGADPFVKNDNGVSAHSLAGNIVNSDVNKFFKFSSPKIS